METFLTKGFNNVKKDWVIGIENPNLNKKLIKEIVNITNKGHCNFRRLQKLL